MATRTLDDIIQSNASGRQTFADARLAAHLEQLSAHIADHLHHVYDVDLADPEHARIAAAIIDYLIYQVECNTTAEPSDRDRFACQVTSAFTQMVTASLETIAVKHGKERQ